MRTEIQQEEKRNRLLRRVDWRFLLPNPNPAQAICFSGGLLAAAVHVISDRVVDFRDDDRGSDCDLAVAVDPDQTKLRAAWNALCPGGFYYTEWYSFGEREPKSIRRRMEEAGFTQLSLYRAIPDPSQSASAVWLPLDSAGAVDFFLSNRSRARTMIRRIGRSLHRALWNSPQLRLVSPVCVIARKPILPGKTLLAPASGTTRASARSLRPEENQPGLMEMIRSRWSSWGLGPTPKALTRLLLTGGERSINKVVALVFAERERQPRVVLKMPRVPDSESAIANEAANLHALEKCRGRVKGVPKRLFFEHHAGVLTLGETFLSGLQLSSLLDKENYRELALKAAAWLVDLAGHSKFYPREAWWNRIVEPAEESFQSSFGSVLDPGLVRECKYLLATLDSLPLVYEQRDFAPWKVLITPEGDLAVLDWESAQPRGLPALDLIYFLTCVAFSLDGTNRSGRFRASYRATLNPSTFTGGVAYDCLTKYISRTNLSPAVIRPLRLLAWMIHSRSEFERMVADVGRRPEKDLLRRSLFVSLWEEELRSAG